MKKIEKGGHDYGKPSKGYFEETTEMKEDDIKELMTFKSPSKELIEFHKGLIRHNNKKIKKVIKDIMKAAALRDLKQT